MTQYQSITSIMQWAGTRVIQYVGGDSSLPYVYKDGMYYYFEQTEQGYEMIMTSLWDLNE